MNTLPPELIQQITQAVLTIWQDQIKDPIILWKHPTIANAFTLKIGSQRKIGLVRTDQNGIHYWKFHWFDPKNLELASSGEKFTENKTQKTNDQSIDLNANANSATN